MWVRPFRAPNEHAGVSLECAGVVLGAERVSPPFVLAGGSRSAWWNSHSANRVHRSRPGARVKAILASLLALRPVV